MYDYTFYTCKNDLINLLEKATDAEERKLLINSLSQLFQDKTKFDVEYCREWTKLDENQRKLWVDHQKNQMDYYKDNKNIQYFG